MDEQNNQNSAPDAEALPPRGDERHDPAAVRARRVLVGSVAAALVVGGGLGAGVIAVTDGASASSEVAQAGSGQGQPGAQGFGGESFSGRSGTGQGGGVPAQGGSAQGEGPTGDSSAQGFGSDGSSSQSDEQGFGSDGSQGGTSDGSGSGSSGAGGTDTSYETATAATSSQFTGVVVIRTVTADGTAAGTGIVLTASGEVVTNAHVIEGATRVVVTVPATGVSCEAKVAGSSTASDIAVLELQGASGLQTATFGDGSTAVGDDVTAVGNAGGQSTLVAATGDVEQVDATITTSAEQGESSETLSGLIAVDADVVAGDSGGALLDSAGEVVGITTAATSGARDVTGYAIPSDDVLSVVHQILARVDS